MGLGEIFLNRPSKASSIKYVKIGSFDPTHPVCNEICMVLHRKYLKSQATIPLQALRILWTKHKQQRDNRNQDLTLPLIGRFFDMTFNQKAQFLPKIS